MKDLPSLTRSCPTAGSLTSSLATLKEVPYYWRWLRRGIELGCNFSINPDAHAVGEIASDLPVIFPKVKSLRRLPAGDGPGKRPRLIGIGDAREQSARRNGGRQLAALIEGGADCGRISLGDDKHPGSMRARIVALASSSSSSP